MKLLTSYPIVATERLPECRDFYARWFGFEHRGDGAFLTLQVEDASSEYERVRAAGLECALGLKDEPLGQRRFAAIAPAGMWATWRSRSSRPRDGGIGTSRRGTTAPEGRYPSPSSARSSAG